MPSKPLSARALIVVGALTATALGMAVQVSAQTATPAPASSGWVVDAARTGDTAAAEVFLAHGADIDAGREGDGTALIVAARNCDLPWPACSWNRALKSTGRCGATETP